MGVCSARIVPSHVVLAFALTSPTTRTAAPLRLSAQTRLHRRGSGGPPRFCQGGTLDLTEEPRSQTAAAGIPPGFHRVPIALGCMQWAMSPEGSFRVAPER